MQTAMKMVCFLALCASAQSVSWGALFGFPQMPHIRHAGLEPSSENRNRGLKHDFLSSATKVMLSEPAVDTKSDLNVEKKPVSITKSEDVARTNVFSEKNNVHETLKTNESQVAKAPIADLSVSANLTVSATVEPPKKPKEPVKRKQRDPEGNLIHSLRFMGDKGEAAVECVTHCRYGEEVRHEWRECLERCVDNPLMRSTFMSMLPKENHVAHAKHVEVPDVLKKKEQRRKDRSSEL